MRRGACARTFSSATWASEGVVYEVEIIANARHADIERLPLRVDEVAEILKALLSGTSLARRTTA